MLHDAASRQWNLATGLVRVRIVKRQPRIRVLVGDDQQAATRRIDAAVEIPVRLGDQFAADCDAKRCRAPRWSRAPADRRAIAPRSTRPCRRAASRARPRPWKHRRCRCRRRHSARRSSRRLRAFRPARPTRRCSCLRFRRRAPRRCPGRGPRCRSRHRYAGSSNTRERHHQPAGFGG